MGIFLWVVFVEDVVADLYSAVVITNYPQVRILHLSHLMVGRNFTPKAFFQGWEFAHQFSEK